MYGAVIIDPADLDPVDHEYVMVQGEAYLHDTGKTASDGNKLAENSPELIAAGTPTPVSYTHLIVGWNISI